jgi:hypothetical protein
MILNVVLFVFNMLPIYPLDGGQILQALLWFFLGRAKSLLVASTVGMVGAAGGIILAVFAQSIWFGIMGAFAAMRCWQGFQQARLLAQLDSAPRHRDARCPSCEAHPLCGPLWQCDECHARFDTFDFKAQCPGCGKQFPLTKCPECQAAHPYWAWIDHDASVAPNDWSEKSAGETGYRSMD